MKGKPPVLKRAKCEAWPAWPEPSAAGGSSAAAALNGTCVRIVDELYASGPGDFEGIFGAPVPADTPSYFELIPHPMDLGTVRAKAAAKKYATLAAFRKDLVLTIENCMTFNMEDSDFHQAAAELASYCHGKGGRGA